MLHWEAQEEWDHAAERIRSEPIFSAWLRHHLGKALERAPLAATRDAEMLAAIARGRRNEALHGDPLRDSSSGPPVRLRKPSDAVTAVAKLTRSAPRPPLTILHLDATRRLVGHSFLEDGFFDSEEWQARDVLAPAGRSGASALIVVQCRGPVAPSSRAETKQRVKRLVEAASLVGIEVSDYVVWDASGATGMLQDGD